MIVGFSALHYGRPFLKESLLSVAYAVDQWVFAYSPTGSHGYRTQDRCPDTEDELREIADKALAQYGVPYIWHKGEWPYEGAQRDMVFNLAPNADLVLVVDSDEIWQTGAALSAVRVGLEMKARSGRVKFAHFWRSFSWVCRDAAMPVRVINPRFANGEAYLELPEIYHMGYAQPPSLIAYKIKTHGHRGEWRAEWFAQTFMPWTPGNGSTDLHPTNRDFWTAQPFDKARLPDLLHEHPYYGMEVIE